MIETKLVNRPAEPPSGLRVATRSLSIAMLGMRGVPATYGGLETVAEEVGARMVQRGHRVTAYCRTAHGPRSLLYHRGVQRVVLPSVRQKHLDTPVHTTLAAMHALLHRSDIVHVFGVGNAPWLPILRLAGKGTVISVDGMDWRRRKWGRLPRWLLARSSLLAIRGADACITDSRAVARWYRDTYGREPYYIAHGVDTEGVVDSGALERYGLRDRGYLLFVGRVTPEKGVHHLLDAFHAVRADQQCVIVGDGSGDPAYWRTLQARAAADGRIRLLGPVYGEATRELFSHAYAYVQPSEIEGTALAIVEAMGHGNCVLVSNIPENLEAVGDAGLTFDIGRPVESLRERLSELFASPALVEEQRVRSREYARREYSWTNVADAHENIYYRVAGASC